MAALESLEKHGFATLPNLFGDECTRRILTEIDQSCATRSRAGIRHALGLPPVAQLANSKPLLTLAQEVLGALAFPFRATLFDKSQAANWLVVWHQDTALPLRKRLEVSGWGAWSLKEGFDYAHAPANVLSQVLALRVHFDDSTLGNGPLRVLPGTHIDGVFTDDRVLELAKSIAPVDCVCPKGGVIAMRPLVVHASSKSRIDTPRRVLHIEYAASRFIADPLQLAVV